MPHGRQSVKHLINEQIHRWLTLHVKQTKDPSVRRIANHLSKQVTTTYTLLALIQLLNESIPNLNSSDEQQPLYGSVFFYKGLSEWKKRLEEQQNTVQEAVTLLNTINSTPSTAPILSMLKVIFNEPAVYLHMELSNLVNIIRSTHLAPVMNLLSTLPIPTVSPNPKESLSEMERNRAWGNTLLGALNSKTVENNLTTQLAMNLLDSILSFYNSELGFIEVDLSLENISDDPVCSPAPIKNHQCVIL